MKTNLPALFKKNKKGGLQTYLISTDENTIICTEGIVGGAMTDHITVCQGKNIGKKNETSGFEQAINEANAKHAKKIKSGYTLSESGEVTVELPMKIRIYQECKDKIIFPCYMSPKLNGVNGEYRIDNEIKLLSRGGEVYPEIPHITPDIAEICRKTGETSFNGELYIHGMYLQDITSAVTKPKISSKQLTFNIFDLPRNKEDYDKRLEILDSIETTENVLVIEVLVAYNHEDIENFHQKCVNNGYEGIVVRNSIGLYEYNIKSLNVFKYKIPKEKEFKIINYKIDAYGHPVFECLCREQINLENNKNKQRTFWVTPKGTHEQKLKMIEEIDSYLNSWYTVEFETYSKDMVPQKPIGIRKRKCDENGEALE